MPEDALKILAALAAATAAIIVSIVSFISTRSNQRAVEKLKADLTERNSESDARRAYAYDALKRLYSQYEPIRFHLVEACESAQELTEQIAEVSNTSEAERVGRIPRGTYLRVARLYHLLLPAVYFKIIQSCLTLVDLEASRSTFLQYLIIKQSCALFCRDRDVADFFRIMYTPYVKGWRELREQDPQRYRRQGFAAGRLENALSTFFKSNDHDLPRVISFGEFENLLTEKAKDFDHLSTETFVEGKFDYNSPIGAAVDLFDDFEPVTRPILWRILLSQYVMHTLFIRAVRSSIEDPDELQVFAAELEPQLSKLTGESQLSRDVLEFVHQVILYRVDLSFKTP